MIFCFMGNGYGHRSSQTVSESGAGPGGAHDDPGHSARPHFRESRERPLFYLVPLKSGADAFLSVIGHPGSS